MGVTLLEIPDPLVPWHLALAAISYAAGGFLIGLFNVAGGVLFAPTLMLLPGVSPVAAVGTVFVSSMPMVLTRSGQLLYYRRLKLKLASPLCLGAGIAAVAGQFALPHIPAIIVKVLVGFIASAAGADVLRKEWKKIKSQKQQAKDISSTEPKQSQAGDICSKESAPNADVEASHNQSELDGEISDQHVKEVQSSGKTDMSAPSEPVSKSSSEVAELPELTVSYAQRGFLVGLLGGFLSSVGGLGGPVIIMPLYFSLLPRTNIKYMAGIISPAAFVNVCVSGVIALAFGSPDVGLALLLCSVSLVMSLVGGAVQERMKADTLRPIVAGILVVFGFVIVARAILQKLL